MTLSREIIPWPDGQEPASFDKLVGPLRDSVDAIYELKRLDDQEIPYVGYDVGDQHVALGMLEQLTPDMLRYDEEDQGRDAMRVILALAVRLGIEQGRRMVEKDAKFWQNLYETSLGMSIL